MLGGNRSALHGSTLLEGDGVGGEMRHGVTGDGDGQASHCGHEHAVSGHGAAGFSAAWASTGGVERWA